MVTSEPLFESSSEETARCLDEARKDLDERKTRAKKNPEWARTEAIRFLTAIDLMESV